MTRTPAARRPGLGLLEVIVAMFVMALGMISLLTLFPLGAIQMGQALRDARAAETAMQADTQMRLWWQQYVVEKGLATGIEDTAFTFFDNPQNGMPTLPIPGDTNPASYPVFIDPLGWQAFNGFPARQTQVAGGGPGGLIPRRSMFWITNDPANTAYPARSSVLQTAFSFRTATMMDDITFNETGTPDTNATGTGMANLVVRQGRYNWAAIIQRPVNANRYVADLKILVFDGRPPGIAPLDAEKIGVPTAAGGPPAVTQQLVLNVGATPPEHLRAGNWIMDGTLTTTGVRNAVWYRVQTIDKESLGPNNYIIDLQTPLLRPVTTTSQFYIFKGLLEVFDRPQLAPPDYKRQLP